MFTALLSFLGSSVFRMLWGEVSHWFTARQEHNQEMDRMRLQGQLDEETAQRNMAAIKLQADLGVKTIQVQSEADLSKTEASGWLAAVEATGKSIGVKWIDAWNGAIRPAVASWSVVMLTLQSFGVVTLTEFTLEICGASLGIFLADRALSKRGK